jgi:hypothetical protein
MKKIILILSFVCVGTLVYSTMNSNNCTASAQESTATDTTKKACCKKGSEGKTACAKDSTKKECCKKNEAAGKAACCKKDEKHDCSKHEAGKCDMKKAATTTTEEGADH